jgi:uncharacterized membrane-anchored protein YhcB (DUF1043 family)
MIEAAVSLLLGIIIGSIAYGHLREQVRQHKVQQDERNALFFKEIDLLKTSNTETTRNLNKILVTLERLSSDINYIKKHIEK